MPEPLTPGQIAYEAHAHFWDRDMLVIPAWRILPPMHREAWEAAAQAVLDAALAHWGEPHVTDDTPCFCGAREEEGVVIHRRLPWESHGQREGDA